MNNSSENFPNATVVQWKILGIKRDKVKKKKEREKDKVSAQNLTDL